MAVITSPRSRREEPARSAVAVVTDALRSPLSDYYLILGSALLLIGFGITMVLSASSVIGQVRYNGDAYYFVKRQVVFLLVGFALTWWLSRRRPAMLRFLGWAGLIAAFALLMLTFVPGIGISVNGNRNWLQLGTSWLRIQPSEFAKLAMIVWGADMLARKEKLLDQPKHLLVPFVPVCLLMAGLVVLERDLGTAMVMVAIMMGILWVVGASWKVLGTLGLLAIGAALFFVQVSSNRLDRLLVFLDPSHAKSGKDEQALRSMYALASGGWWGRGLGQSRQKWGSLAEAHTDFVFAILGEELGLVGSLVVVALFCVLGYAGLRVATRSDSPFARYASAGITTWFLVQACVNILVVLRLLPVLGVPLPFISYGGSALLANLLALGVLLACARHEPEARRILQKPVAAPAPRLSTVVDGGRS